MYFPSFFLFLKFSSSSSIFNKKKTIRSWKRELLLLLLTRASLENGGFATLISIAMATPLSSFAPTYNEYDSC